MCRTAPGVTSEILQETLDRRRPRLDLQPDLLRKTFEYLKKTTIIRTGGRPASTWWILRSTGSARATVENTMTNTLLCGCEINLPGSRPSRKLDESTARTPEGGSGTVRGRSRAIVIGTVIGIGTAIGIETVGNAGRAEIGEIVAPPAGVETVADEMDEVRLGAAIVTEIAAAVAGVATRGGEGTDRMTVLLFPSTHREGWVP